MTTDLPSGWSWATLGECCTSAEKIDPRKTPAAQFDYIDIGGVQPGSGRIYATKRVRGSDAPSRARQRVRQGDIILLPLPVSASCVPAMASTRGAGKPLAGATVLALFPNKSWKRAVTDARGEALLELHSAEPPMTVFVASEGCSAHVERDAQVGQSDLIVEQVPARVEQPRVLLDVLMNGRDLQRPAVHELTKFGDCLEPGLDDCLVPPA